VAGVPHAIFNCAADTAASTATPFGESEIRPDHLFQLELVAHLISTAFLAGTAGECLFELEGSAAYNLTVDQDVNATGATPSALEFRL
jgi:hypothetical protein